MAELFIAVLGASNFTYADATWTQSLPDWIGAHVRMFRFFWLGAATVDPGQSQEWGQQAVRFTTLKSNRSYGKMAAHYNIGVAIPARPRKPKDKAKVEAGVRFAPVSANLGRHAQCYLLLIG